MKTDNLFPFWAEIKADTTGHYFKKGNVVEIIDLFETYKALHYYHATFDGKVICIISDNDFNYFNPDKTKNHEKSNS
jgi:hypothetical protein